MRYRSTPYRQPGPKGSREVAKSPKQAAKKKSKMTDTWTAVLPFASSSLLVPSRLPLSFNRSP